MPFYREFDNIFDAGDRWDLISKLPQTCAAMLFFRRTNGIYGTGPYWVWSSDEGEARHIAKAMPITGLQREDMEDRLRLRNAFADWRAATHRRASTYRHTGHAEEFLVNDFADCLAKAGAANVERAHISITWSPCIGELDSKASTNFGAARGCYSKLILLAARYRPLHFDVSFKVGYGHFAGNGDAAANYMNASKPTQANISFTFAPRTG